MSRMHCVQCRKTKGFCYCERIMVCNNDWPIWILQHPNEQNHALGTVPLAAQCLENISQYVAPNIDQCNDLMKAMAINNPVLIFPASDSQPIDQLDTTVKRPLLFLDATWRKAKRMWFESPQLQSLESYTIATSDNSRYRIRKAPKLSNSSEIKPVSTLEAIVETLSFLEQDYGKYQSMLTLMDWLIDQQIKRMGSKVFEENYSQSSDYGIVK